MRPSRTRMRTESTVACGECGAGDAIQIEMTLPDGTEVHFCSCHRCENRWWDNGGRPVELNAVLDMARPVRR